MGVELNVCKFELPLIVNRAEPEFIFFYECSLKPGLDLKGYYHLTRKGRPLPLHEMAFKTMEVGKAKRAPSRFTNDMFYLDAKVLRHWLPRDTVASYRKLGFNRISVNVLPVKNQTPYTGSDPKSREDYYDLLFGEMNRTGQRLFFTTNSSSATPQAWQWTHNDKDARAIAADGKEAPYNQYNYPSLCPTYRGKYFQEHVGKLLDSYVFKEYHCTWLTLDLELWPQKSWEAGCYCKRCLGQFKSYCQKHKPEWLERDPAAVMREGHRQSLQRLLVPLPRRHQGELYP